MSSEPKYSVISVEDEDADFETFELENEHTPQDSHSKRRTFLLTATLFSFALLLVLTTTGFVAHTNKSHDGGEEAPTRRVTPTFLFCYGDSLTSGQASIAPPDKSPGPYPYSVYLEWELNYLIDPESSLAIRHKQAPPTVVHHLGIPGWTAENMLNNLDEEHKGLCSVVYRTPVSLLIILVGKNDIHRLTPSDDASKASVILSQITELHKAALECSMDDEKKDFAKGKLHTLALGIPGSLFQDHVPVAAKVAAEVNSGLKSFAESFPGGKMHYIDFPIPYVNGVGGDGDGSWNEDGVHMTKKGYNRLAKQLAPKVKDILDGMDSD